MKRPLIILLSALFIAFNISAQDQPEPFTDNFDDGDISDWESILGAGVQVAPWPVIAGKLQIALGGSITGDAKPPGVELDDFVVEVEVQRDSWSGSNFGTGLIARFNSGNGYFHSLRSDVMRIYVIVGGRITELAQAPVNFNFDSGEAVRIVFTGSGESLTAQAYTLDNQLVSEAKATHSQWTTGRVGVVNVTRGTTAIYDNFKAYHPDNPPQPEAGPSIQVVRHLEFGRLPVAPETHDKILSIVNSGGSDLVISSASLTGTENDHFSIAEAQFPITVGPVEAVDVTLTFDSHGETGGFQAEFNLTSNDAAQSVSVTASVINVHGPVAHYPLDETEPDVMRDITGYGRSGIYGENVSLKKNAIASGTSVEGLGKSVATVGWQAFGEGAFESFSVSLWFQAASIAATSTLISIASEGRSPAFALIIEDGQIGWFEEDVILYRTSEARLEDSGPYHVVAAFEPERITFFIDGKAVGHFDRKGESLDLDPESKLSIGGFGELEYHGLLDDLQIYDRVLVPSEVQFLHDNPGEPIRTSPSDSDGDGLTDEEEVNIYETHPLLADTDGDQRTDGEEVLGEPMTDPLNADTDGFDDGFEVCQDADPNDPNSLPADMLGKPDHFWQEFAVLDTFNGFDSNADGKDVTFRAFIDFEDYQSSENDREIIWETGAGTVGFSLVYESGNRLVLRAAGNAGLSVATVKHALTQSQIEAGELSVIWTFDIDNGQSPESQTIALYLDEALVGDASANLGPDWSGSNAAAFGVFGSIFAAGGNNTALDNGVDFQSGTINLQTGLQMYVDRLFEAERIWTLTIASNDRAGGEVTQGGLHAEGDVVTLRATPAEGYHFVRWEGEGIADPTASETEVTVTRDATIIAVFAKDISPGRTITVNPVIDGFTVSFEKLPMTGIQVSWSGGGTLQRLDAATQMMVDVETISPFLSETPSGIFRVLDPWESGRATEVYVPGAYKDEIPMPLVIVLHGLHPDPSYIRSYLKIQELADSKGILLAQPNGLPTSFQNRVGWNDGVSVADASVDDTSYLRGLILATMAQLNVDPQRVYLYGHSNGGSVAYRTVRRHADLIAGVASLEGSPLVIPTEPSASEPLHLLHVHGTDASDGPAIEGGPFPLGGTIASVREILQEFGSVARHDQLIRAPDKTLDLQDNLPGIDTTVIRMTGGDEDIAVEFWEIEGSRHFSPGNHDDFSEEVIDWLLSHPKPEKQTFSQQK